MLEESKGLQEVAWTVCGQYDLIDLSSCCLTVFPGWLKKRFDSIDSVFSPVSEVYYNCENALTTVYPDFYVIAPEHCNASLFKSGL